MGWIGVGKFLMIFFLFWLIESVGGEIIIDGVRIFDLGFYELRLKIIILL